VEAGSHLINLLQSFPGCGYHFKPTGQSFYPKVGCPLADALCACKHAAYEKSNFFGLLVLIKEQPDFSVRLLNTIPLTAYAHSQNIIVSNVPDQ
jgi:hypothetical protein